MSNPLVKYLKHKERIQKRAQQYHDKKLKEYQERTRDYGYINFIDPRTNPNWNSLLLLGDYEKIDPSLVSLAIDNRTRKPNYDHSLNRV